MPAFQIVNSFSQAAANGDHDFGADVFKLMFMNTAPSVSNTIPANWTEIAAGNGYIAGGLTLTLTPALVGNVTDIGVANTSQAATGGGASVHAWSRAQR